MNRPLISVLMLTYNGVQFLKAAIESVRHQTYENWELIISDDCSEDGTWELAQALATKDPRIKVFKNEKRLGITKNRAAAFSHTSGELIGHLDGDDMLERWALEEMWRAFVRKPDVGLVYSDLAQISVNNTVELYSASPSYNPNVLHQHGWRHFGMYRRSAYESTEGYNTKLLSACEDGDLFMQIAEKFPCYRLTKVLYYYRNHGDNASKTKTTCEDCTQRTECNYMRVWAKSANYDPVTFKSIPKE
jgi:glycosyltransferase involved in cell wall biosynthesis